MSSPLSYIFFINKTFILIIDLVGVDGLVCSYGKEQLTRAQTNFNLTSLAPYYHSPNSQSTKWYQFQPSGVHNINSYYWRLESSVFIDGRYYKETYCPLDWERKWSSIKY